MPILLLETQGAKSGLAPLAQSMLMIAGIFILIYLLAVLAPKISDFLVKIFPALKKTNEPKPIEPMTFNKKEEQQPEGKSAPASPVPEEEPSGDRPKKTEQKEQSK